MSEKNKIIKICMQAIILLSIAATIAIVIMFGISKDLSELAHNWGFFKTYTVDSNILMGIVSAIMLYFLIFKKDKIPKWVYTLQLTGASVVMVTFITVVVFLGPMRMIKGESIWIMFSKELFFLHFLNPVLAFISTALLSDKHTYTKKECIISLIPTVLYSVIYLYNVIISKKWFDFYGFTFGGKYYLMPFVIIIMYGLAFSMAVLIKKIHNTKKQI